MMLGTQSVQSAWGGAISNSAHSARRPGPKAGTKAAILAAATALFAERGVTATSMEDIAEKANVAKGSVYYNFTSKAGLVEELMHSYLDRMRSVLAEATQDRHGVELTCAVVAALLREIEQHPQPAKIMLTEVFRTERSWRDAAAGWRDATMGPLIDEAIRENGETGREQAYLLAAAQVGAVLTAGMEWLVFRPHLSYAEVRDAIFISLGLMPTD